MRLIVLASGSSGNAALVESGGRAVLLDAGVSAREIARRAQSAGASDARIEAILVTHEHIDHIRGARVLARKLGVPVIATAGTLGAGARYLEDVSELVAIDQRGEFVVAGMRVRSFATMHDAAEPCGFVFESARARRVGVATDTGMVTPEIAESLAGCHVIGLESNHDTRMLEDGPYPYFLKRRIAGDRGHLSNADAADALSSLAWHGLSRVFALHLSEQNNTPERARFALDAALRGRTTAEAVARCQTTGCAV